MSADFTRRKLAFLDRLATGEGVAPDKRISPGAFRTIHWLVSRYMNSKTGDCYPSQERLARDLNMDPRTVRKHLAEGVKKQALTMRRQGRDRPNIYSIVDDDRNIPSAHSDGMTGTVLSDDRNGCSVKTGTDLPGNPIKEPTDEPRENLNSKVSSSTSGVSKALENGGPTSTVGALPCNGSPAQPSPTVEPFIHVEPIWKSWQERVRRPSGPDELQEIAATAVARALGLPESDEEAIRDAFWRVPSDKVAEVKGRLNRGELTLTWLAQLLVQHGAEQRTPSGQKTNPSFPGVGQEEAPSARGAA